MHQGCEPLTLGSKSGSLTCSHVATDKPSSRPASASSPIQWGHTVQAELPQVLNGMEEAAGDLEKLAGGGGVSDPDPRVFPPASRPEPSLFPAESDCSLLGSQMLSHHVGSLSQARAFESSLGQDSLELSPKEENTSKHNGSFLSGPRWGKFRPAVSMLPGKGVGQSLPSITWTWQPPSSERPPARG